jgi:hypothetical protein|tara:strand:- start:131 stop:502 length:372 start_codon:yes stop_codon:yes gene_type:complete
MRGPEAKLYQKFKRASKKILWHRIENLAVPGMPDALGYTENFFYFTVEFKVTKSNKVRLSPHQIAYHIAHPHNSFICVKHLGSGIVKLYEGSMVRELVACGLELDAWRLGLDACCLALEELGA